MRLKTLYNIIKNSIKSLFHKRKQSCKLTQEQEKDRQDLISQMIVRSELDEIIPALGLDTQNIPSQINNWHILEIDYNKGKKRTTETFKVPFIFCRKLGTSSIHEVPNEEERLALLRESSQPFLEKKNITAHVYYEFGDSIDYNVSNVINYMIEHKMFYHN